MPGGGVRLPARLATLASASRGLVVGAAREAAGMEASHYGLGPRGDRSERDGGCILLSGAEG